ncbi:glyoxylase-like metal-dependent hydrolase (beta-lactamase superfamily II) [Ochrobactrum daejeonense]|uniref:Glyoxylase-like metal-dependent hydrolase (Beta-lactamase superfamily II) n=1 Tax=Brucella daejeonensis TaxID=659015 RepID=A0A7W9EQ63_9HYPH|nr:MBL fold metallo-hydrolase [Brucella daejeonensis]MBB5704491.1 glyoxylase-like metal-dependent hydrolase (beta-lactamase superfamily II) [Brucella daejeonensis]
MSAPKLGYQNAGWFRFNIGDFEATVLWDGYIHHGYEGIFPNAAPEELSRLQQKYLLPTDHIPMDLNPVVINTGERLVLVDAGMGQTSKMFGPCMGFLVSNMRASGIEPEQIDAVLMTHLHPDHSFGLIDENGQAIFSSADLWCARPDWDEWTNETNVTLQSHHGSWTRGTLEAVAPYRQRLHLFDPGDEIFHGVSTFSVAGHAAGMVAYIFESAGEKCMFTGDACHHQIYDPYHPEWFFHMDFDTNPEQGAASKLAILKKAVDEGIRYHGYHFPFPGLGDVQKQEDGTFRFIPQAVNPRL